jgi:hypothetical protein
MHRTKNDSLKTLEPEDQLPKEVSKIKEGVLGSYEKASSKAS